MPILYNYLRCFLFNKNNCAAYMPVVKINIFQLFLKLNSVV